MSVVGLGACMLLTLIYFAKIANHIERMPLERTNFVDHALDTDNPNEVETPENHVSSNNNALTSTIQSFSP
jgi:hypothetical protein